MLNNSGTNNQILQGGARGPGADNGLIFLNMCTVVVVVDLSVRSAGGITVWCRMRSTAAV